MPPIIDTGSSREKVPTVFQQVHDAAVNAIAHFGGSKSLYAYGSVVTGRAETPTSDVDLLTIGVSADRAVRMADALSERFSTICRGVEIAAAQRADFIGDTDEAYGNRVFLRHYCVRLTGPDDLRPTKDFPGDERAVRGFNGDIAQHARRWQDDLDAGIEPPSVVARRLARKSLLALAGLVSIHDRIWTTDRRTAADRWSDIDPARRDGIEQLLCWSAENSNAAPTPDDVQAALDSTVAAIVATFSEYVGLWPDSG